MPLKVMDASSGSMRFGVFSTGVVETGPGAFWRGLPRGDIFSPLRLSERIFGASRSGVPHVLLLTRPTGLVSGR